jgi:RNA polymerase sigma-70 factor, ECF subfamily
MSTVRVSSAAVLAEAPEESPVLYCLIPREAAHAVEDAVRLHFADDPDIEVIVERRRRERRDNPDRRAASDGAVSEEDERRRIRAVDGRRVGERRSALVAVPGPTLPRRLRRHLEGMTFAEAVAPSGQEREDRDTAHLVTRIQAGEWDAFSDLYLRYFDRVYAYLRVALRDPHEAEDATQQVFTNVIGALPRYERRKEPFRAWLFRIVRNQAVDALRKRRHVEPEEPDVLEQRWDPHGREAEARALRWLSDREMLVFLERLPLAQRQVLTMRYLLDLHTRDIAEVLDRSQDWVRQTQRRGLQTLERRLVRLGSEPSKRDRRLSMARLRRWRANLRDHRFTMAA